jgi:hypothetical protein
MKEHTQTPLSRGNNSLRTGKNLEAIQQYILALFQSPSLAKIIGISLERARIKYRESRNNSEKSSAAIWVWEFSDRIPETVLKLFHRYESIVDIAIIDGNFQLKGWNVDQKKVNTETDTIISMLNDQSNFFSKVILFVAAHPFDLVHLYKPHLVNFLIGLLYKNIWSAQVLVHIGRENIEKPDANEYLRLDEYLCTRFNLPNLKDLYGNDSSQLVMKLANNFDAVTFDSQSIEQAILKNRNQPLTKEVAQFAMKLEDEMISALMDMNLENQKQKKYSLIASQSNGYKSVTANDCIGITLKKNQHDLIMNNISNRLFCDWRSLQYVDKNPIQLQHNEKKILRAFGAAFLGPALAYFFSSLFNNLKHYDNIGNIFFLAREGFLLEYAYKKFQTNLSIVGNSKYLLVSRALTFKLSFAKPQLWEKSLGHLFKGTLTNLLAKRYGFTPKEINLITMSSAAIRNNRLMNISLPEDREKIKHIFMDALDMLNIITRPKLAAYSEYLKDIGFGEKKEEHLIDLGYSGTIQSLLSSLTGVETIGHYFMTTKHAVNNDKTKYNGYLLSNVHFGDGNLLLDRSLYFESILTAPHGTVIDIKKEKENTRFIYGVESESQYRFFENIEIMEGAIDYAITVYRKQLLMQRDELLDYYNAFLSNKRNFPSYIIPLLEMDDDISGSGIINPKNIFQ